MEQKPLWIAFYGGRITDAGFTDTAISSFQVQLILRSLLGDQMHYSVRLRPWIIGRCSVRLS